SLEAIDRIAQITQFQGRRLLDGSLDFITTGVPSSVSDLQIDQANLGTAGSISVTIDIAAAATQASITNTDGVDYVEGDKATGLLSFLEPRAVQTSGDGELNGANHGEFRIRAVAGGVADGTAGNDLDVIIVDGAGAPSARYDADAGTITVPVDVSSGPA